MRRIGTICCFCMCAFFIFVLYCAPVRAAIFYLDAKEDLPDANPGDGAALTETGVTTLRAAIDEANALPGRDEIVFTYGASSKEWREKGGFRAGHAYVESPLLISDDLVIKQGNFPFSVLDPRGRDQFRVLEVLPGVRLEMIGIHIAESLPLVQNMIADRGAAIYIHPVAEVILRDCQIQSGVATVAGGGIYVDRGMLTLRTFSYVSGYSEGDGGGVYNDRGFVRVYQGSSLLGTAENMGGACCNNQGHVVFASGGTYTSLHRGKAMAGGGLYSDGGFITLASVAIIACEATYGGGIFLTNDTYMQMVGCSLSGNLAAIHGGSIFIESSLLRALNCTFGKEVYVGTTRAGVDGGAIFALSGDIALINCTIAENSAAGAGLGAGGGLAVHPAGGAILRLGNSIIAGNTDLPGSPGADVSGNIVSLGHNLIGVADGGTGYVESDLLGVQDAPLLALLAFTLHHEGRPESPGNIYVPQMDSPALDAGDNSLLFSTLITASPCFDMRQSCCPRVRGAAVDIGAIEVQEGEIGLECTGSHSADYDRDNRLSLSELLRVFQFYNSGEYHCESWTEDGYELGPGDQDCAPHSADYNPQDWRISLRELLRLIQFYNSGGYYPCPGSEDGFCPGSAA